MKSMKKGSHILIIGLALMVVGGVMFGGVGLVQADSHTTGSVQGGTTGDAQGGTTGSVDNPEETDDTTGVSFGRTFQITNPLKAEGINELVGDIATFLFTIATGLVIVFVLYGAYQIMTSGGNPDRVTAGRKTILWALIGFVFVIIAGGAASIIGDILGVKDPVDGALSDIDVGEAPVQSTGDILALIVRIAQWMFGILLALGIVFVLYAAFLYMTSGGDTEKASTAQRVLTYAIVAMVIGVVAGGLPVLVQNLIDPDFTVSEESIREQCVDRCIKQFGSEIGAQSCISACQ